MFQLDYHHGLRMQPISNSTNERPIEEWDPELEAEAEARGEVYIPGATVSENEGLGNLDQPQPEQLNSTLSEPEPDEVVLDLAPLDDMAIDPSLLALDLHDPAHKHWAALISMPVENTQKHDNLVLQAQQHRAGYVVGYAAGPIGIFKLFDFEPLMTRPVVQANVTHIYTMLEAGDKYDWQHPLVAQVNTSNLSDTCVVWMHDANPRQLGAPGPRPLIAKVHHDRWLNLLRMTWQGTHPQSGAVLSSQIRFELDLELKEFEAKKPLVIMMHGNHRLEALRCIEMRGEAMRLQWIEARDAGNVDKAMRLWEELEHYIRRSAFLMEIYPTTIPADLARVLAENAPPLPRVPPTFGEMIGHLWKKLITEHSGSADLGIWSCRQLLSFGRSEIENGPKSDDTFNLVKHVLKHPLGLQMCLSNSSMISILDLCVQPISNKVTQDSNGMILAHAWLSLELLKMLLLHRLPSTSRIANLMKMAVSSVFSGLSEVTILEAAHAWSLGTDLPDNQLPSLSLLIDERIMFGYEEKWNQYVMPTIKRLHASGQAIDWQDNQVVMQMRICMSSFGTWLTRLSDWEKYRELYRTIIIYAALPLIHLPTHTVGFIPHAQLPCHRVLKQLVEPLQWTAEGLAPDMIWFGLNPLSMLGADLPLAMAAQNGFQCSCPKLHSFIHQFVFSDLHSPSHLFRLTKVIQAIEKNTVKQHFEQVTTTAVASKCLNSQTDYRTHMVQLAKYSGLGLKSERSTLFIKQCLPALEGLAQGQLNQEIDNSIIKINKFGSQHREYKDLAQAEFTKQHVFASNFLEYYWGCVDLHGWSDTLPQSQRKRLGALAMGYGFLCHYFKHHIISPLLTHSLSARQLLCLTELGNTQPLHWSGELQTLLSLPG